MRAFRRILHAHDFSPVSRRAFATALEWARRSRGELRLIHVLEPMRPPMEGSLLSVRGFVALEAETRQRTEAQLERLVARARAGGVRAAAVALTGEPADEIVREARRWRADLAVLGTHGRTGLRSVFLGSVAARVVGLARCPVLTVRA